MEARGRDEATEPFEELHRREPDLGASVQVGSGETVDQPSVR
jgi:hypothetical protein